MTKITCYCATISPFTYLAGTRLDEIAKKHGAEVTYKPVDLMSLFSTTGGVPPKDRHPSRQEYRLQELKRQAKKNGMTLNMQPKHFPTDMKPSSYALIAAQEAGGGSVAELLYNFTSACWAEDKDVAELSVIQDCLARAGFDPNLANDTQSKWVDIYETNLEEAINEGAFGAPFYITDADERFWGQDRLEDLDLHLAGSI